MTPLPRRSDSGPQRADLRIGTDLLQELVDEHNDVLTSEVMLVLAGHLCHLAGGDGRGVYSIVHDPTGDRV
jgi:hypothetical protein